MTVHVRDFILHDSSMGVANYVIGNTFSSIFRPGFSFKGLSSLRITEMIHSYQVCLCVCACVRVWVSYVWVSCVQERSV